jgi:CRISPR-associated protein Cas1
MIKRTVEVSRTAAYLSTQDEQLVIRPARDRTATPATIPYEDIGVVVVDEPGCTYTHQTLAKLVEAGAVLVICGPKHLPVGILLPLPEHTQVVWRVQEQLSVSQPVRKQLWKQIVQAKIRAQARVLREDCPARRQILRLAEEVLSGDPDNLEGQAARIYWQGWLEDAIPFRRNPDSEDIVNALLNYGYAILRAAVARAIVAGGLLPAVGLHHCNRSDAFCLADDLMEPLRPLVDERAKMLWLDGCRELDRRTKAGLLEVLTATVRVMGLTGPLMVALHRVVASLVRCYQGREKDLALPEAVDE